MLATRGGSTDTFNNGGKALRVVSPAVDVQASDSSTKNMNLKARATISGGSKRRFYPPQRQEKKPLQQL